MIACNDGICCRNCRHNVASDRFHIKLRLDFCLFVVKRVNYLLTLNSNTGTCKGIEKT